MHDMHKYLQAYGNSTLEEMPLNDVDLLILAQLSYTDFDHMVPGGEAPLGVSLGALLARYTARPHDASRGFFSFQSKDNEQLYSFLEQSPRFAQMRVIGFIQEYDAEHEQQFAALTLLPGDDTMVIAYRGTDDTLFGWKESFNLAFTSPVPSQTRALLYLKSIASIIDLPIRLCGHSKGGNVAVYAAAFCGEEIQKRIVQVVSFDGPGLDRAASDSGEYLAIADRVHLIMPRSSIVGLLLDQRAEAVFIDSRMPSLLQHYPYNWGISGDCFALARKQSASGAYISRTMQHFLDGLSYDERQAFVEAVYRILCASEADSLSELLENWWKNIGRIIKALSGVDKETSKLFLYVIKTFLYAAVDFIEWPSDRNKPPMEG